MMKWKIATVLGVAFGVAGVSWGYAQQKQAPGFFELRVYTAQPGKRDALAERFATRTAAIFARHGITRDEHARQQREKLITAKRRRELDGEVDDLVKGLNDLVELRYVRDRISAKLAKPRGG